MVGLHGEMTLIDWELAPKKSIDYATGECDRSEDRVLGTAVYASSEQVSSIHENAEVDERSDLYSLFVVLFELLTLQPYVPKGGGLWPKRSTVFGPLRLLQCMTLALPPQVRSPFRRSCGTF